MIGRRRVTATLLALAAVSLSVGAATGCGDEDSGDEVTIPSISLEQTTTEDAPTTAETETGGQTTTGDSGSGSESGSGSGGTSFDPNRPDGPTNDKPPEPGSPEEAFENYCKDNPGACG